MSPGPLNAKSILSALALLGLVALAVLRPPQTIQVLRCPGERFELVTAPGGLSPYIRLEADGRAGAFLIDTGTEASSLSADLFSGTGGRVSRFSLPTFPSGQFQLSKYWVLNQPSGGQYGIVGTDFLSLLTADFSFAPPDAGLVLGAQSCDRAVLSARGLTPISQTGYFSADAAQARSGRPNVPVVFLRLGGVATYAQIDTGYDDARLRPAIDINEALYQKLLASGVVLQRDGSVDVATCDGRGSVDVYRSAGLSAGIETETGLPIAAIGDVHLIRKPANRCGGIGTRSEPAAQLGVSILHRLGDLVIDPRAGLVWVGGRQK